MNPIISLSLAHIGTRITVHDRGSTITGPLMAIEAARETAVLGVLGGVEQAEPGAWDHIILIIGDIRVGVREDAEREAP